MEGAAGKGGSAEEAATLNDAPLTTCVGGGPLQTILHPGPEPVSPPRRDSIVDVLEQHAVEAATSSHDFGRGYMHAVRVARDMELDAKLRHHERQLCSTELLILAGRSADQDTAGVLIEAAVAISRRQVA